MSEWNEAAKTAAVQQNADRIQRLRMEAAIRRWAPTIARATALPEWMKPPRHAYTAIGVEVELFGLLLTCPFNERSSGGGFFVDRHWGSFGLTRWQGDDGTVDWSWETEEE